MADDIVWRDGEFLFKLENATDEMNHMIALQILAEAIPNVRRDTGFLANTGYVSSPLSETFQRQASRRVPSGSKSTRLYETVPNPPDGDDTIVGFAANYALYVEARYPFLYPAMLTTQRHVGGIVEEVGRRNFG